LVSLTHAGGPVIDIPPGTLPAESFFTANPGATVNVSGGENIFPDAGDGTAFTFNGATVNLEATASSGFFTLDHFMEDVTFNINGGELVRCRFVGGTGTTTLNLNSGSAERGLWLQGNAAGVQNGGLIGVVGGGQAALIVEDDATFTMNDGTIDTFVVIQENAVMAQTGGSIVGPLQINDDAVVTVSGGSSGNNGFIRDPGGVLNVSGGTVGGSFVAEQGTVNLTGGGLGENSAILNSGFGVIDPVFNMTGGALGGSFRAYDGTMNISGGLIGDRFRIGRPTGDGSGITVNLTVKSATLAGDDLELSTTPATITARGGEFLSCILLDDSLIGITLNESSGTEDYVRSGAVLTIALAECDADFNGDGDINVLDVVAFITNWNMSGPGADFNTDGSINILDVVAFIGIWNTGCP
jgi:hypothetical protein